MKYNLKSIMKKAWEIKKENKENIFSICLKMAWEEAKRNTITTKFYGVKDWFLKKTLTRDELYAYNVGDGAYIARETEKAVLVKNMTDYGMISFWCPKSCLLKKEESPRNFKKELFQRMENGLKYNEILVTYAKNNGVKGVRTGMRTVTLIKKIEDAGLDVPARF